MQGIDRAGGESRSNVESDSLDRDLSVTLRSKDELVHLVALRSHSCANSIAAVPQERAAINLLHALDGHLSPLSVVHEMRSRMLMRVVVMTAEQVGKPFETVDRCEALHVLCAM